MHDSAFLTETVQHARKVQYFKQHWKMLLKNTTWGANCDSCHTLLMLSAARRHICLTPCPRRALNYMRGVGIETVITRCNYEHNRACPRLMRRLHTLHADTCP